jgi:hypothetical protein
MVLVSFVFCLQKIVFIGVFVTDVEVLFGTMRNRNPFVVQKFDLEFDSPAADFGISMGERDITG